RRHVLRAAQQFQAARRPLAQGAAGDEPQNEVQQQLEESESPSPAHSLPYRQRPPRLPAQDLDRDQPKPRDGEYRGFAGTEHVKVSGRYYRTTGTKRSGQVRPEQVHPRSRLVRVPPPTGLQAG